LENSGVSTAPYHKEQFPPRIESKRVMQNLSLHWFEGRQGTMALILLKTSSPRAAVFGVGLGKWWYLLILIIIMNNAHQELSVSEMH